MLIAPSCARFTAIGCMGALRLVQLKRSTTAPTVQLGWKWGTGRQERCVLLYNGDEAEPDYY
eukprot:4026368-Amphidinium_carterae.1